MSNSVTTPGQVAGTSLGAIAFGIFLWLVIRYAIIPWWGARRGDGVFQWALPALFVVGGLVGEIVAAYGAITGNVWHTS